jgi:hypothetical protein
LIPAAAVCALPELRPGVAFNAYDFGAHAFVDYGYKAGPVDAAFHPQRTGIACAAVEFYAVLREDRPDHLMRAGSYAV